LRKLDPRAKLAIVLMMSAAVFLLGDPRTILGAFAASLFLWRLARLGFRDLVTYAKPLVFIFVFLVLTQGFFYAGEASRLFGTPLKPEGLVYGLVLCVRVMTLACTLPFLLATSTIEELVLGLTKLGLPYRTAYTATTALNQVPVLRADIASIIAAQKLRGCAAFEGKNPLRKLKAYPALVVPLVMSAMRRANLMGTAMDARAFGSSKTRTSIHGLRFKIPDFLTIVTAFLVLGGLVLADRLVR
jgi:energy-coupling factor transport system permease protein